MSVIAYRNGVMAADSRAFGGRNEPSPGSKTKIRRLDDGTLIGASSNAIGGVEHILKWYADGMPKLEDRPEYFSLIVAKPDGALFVAIDSLYLSGPIESEFFAIGTGNQYAMGAMAHGAGPEYACEIACRLDAHSGAPVIALTHAAA